MRAPAENPLSFFCITAPGLEAITAAELKALGLPATIESGGVSFVGGPKDLFLASLHLRTASRILLRLASFEARAFYELERRARKLPWERFLRPGRPVRLRVSCQKSRLYHEGAVAERFLSAIARTVGEPAPFTKPQGGGGEEEGKDAQLVFVRFLHDLCTVSVDTSGALLHQRGYRQALSKAPLRETLAAALLFASGWNGQAPLIDPFCGSGTIAIEAALLARRIAPGLAHPENEPRRYAFQEWPDFDEALFSRQLTEAREAVLPAAGVPILASDHSARAIESARANAARAGVAADLTLETKPLSSLEPPPGPGFVVTNPPYGVRLGERQALRDLYAEIGRLAKGKLSGWTLALLSADRRLEAEARLRFREALRTKNGGISVRLVVAGQRQSSG